MKKVFVIAGREYKEFVKKKFFWIWTVLGPIILFGIMAIPMFLAQMDTGKQYQIFVDADQSILSALISTKAENINFLPMPANANLNDFKKELSDKKDDGEFGLLHFAGDIYDDKSQAVLYLKNVGDFDAYMNIKSLFNDVIISMRFKEQNVPENVKSLMKKIEVETIKLSKDGDKKSDFQSSYLTAFVLSMIVYSSIIGFGNILMKGIIDEKNSHIMEILISSIKPFGLMMGKILGILAVGITQILVWVGVASSLGLYASHGNETLLAVFANFSLLQAIYFPIFLILGYFLMSAVFTILGASFNSSKDAQQIMVIINYMLIAPLILGMLIAKSPNGIVSRILSLFPLTSPVAMIMRLTYDVPPFWEMVIAIVILLVSIIVMIKAAAKIFRVGILMRGKKPTPIEILKWLKY